MSDQATDYNLVSAILGEYMQHGRSATLDRWTAEARGGLNEALKREPFAAEGGETVMKAFAAAEQLLRGLASAATTGKKAR